MHRFSRLLLFAGAAIYLLVTLPLLALLARSEYFRTATGAELTRKLSHLRPMEGVFCGDSLTAAISDWGRRLDLRPFSTLNLAIPGLRVAQVRDQVQRASLLKSARVVVMAGTNDLLDPRQTDEAILADWERILRIPPSRDPQIRIVVSIPFQADRSTDGRIHALNDGLKLAAGQAGWTFLDLNAHFAASGVPRGELFTDGWHFSERAYRLWCEALAAVFRAGSEGVATSGSTPPPPSRSARP